MLKGHSNNLNLVVLAEKAQSMLKIWVSKVHQREMKRFAHTPRQGGQTKEITPLLVLVS